MTEVLILCNLLLLNLNLDHIRDDKESLIKCLADMPVGLMPDVLAFIQREGDQIQSMSIMNAAMQWCDCKMVDKLQSLF